MNIANRSKLLKTAQDRPIPITSRNNQVNEVQGVVNRIKSGLPGIKDAKTRDILSQALDLINRQTDDNRNFSAIRDNFEIIWERVGKLRDTESNVTTITPGGGGGGTPTTGTGATPGPFVDEFRHFASMIDFEYDYVEKTWTSGLVTALTFRKGGVAGAIQGSATLNYNSDNQLTSATMGSKTITVSYDNDGFMINVART